MVFLLRRLSDAIKEMSKTQNDRQNIGTNVGVNVGTNEEKILLLLKQDGTLTAKMLAGTLGVKRQKKS